MIFYQKSEKSFPHEPKPANNPIKTENLVFLHIQLNNIQILPLKYHN